jgi:hypothetical protein
MLAGFGRPLYLIISLCTTPAQSTFVPLLFVVARVGDASLARAIDRGPPGAKIVARVGCTTPAQVCEKIDRAISITYPLSRLERRAVASYTQWEIALGPAAKVGKAQIFASARESVVPRSK